MCDTPYGTEDQKGLLTGRKPDMVGTAVHPVPRRSHPWTAIGGHECVGGRVVRFPPFTVGHTLTPKPTQPQTPPMITDPAPASEDQTAKVEDTQASAMDDFELPSQQEGAQRMIVCEGGCE